MVSTSTTLGMFDSTHSPPPRIVEARIGKAAFFAPLVRTSPFSRRPP